MPARRQQQRRAAAGLAALLAAAAMLAEPAIAARSFSAPVDLSSGESATAPEVAMDGNGDGVVAWEETGATPIIRGAVRPAGGSFGTPVDLGFGSLPRLAGHHDGGVALLWSHSSLDPVRFRPNGGTFGESSSVDLHIDHEVAIGGGGSALAVGKRICCSGMQFIVTAFYRPAGGAFEPAKGLGSGSRADAAVDDAGNAVVVWGHGWAAYRPAGGAFGSAVQLSDPGQRGGGQTHVAMDRAGNAIAVWNQPSETNQFVEASVRPAGGDWGPRTQISTPGGDAVGEQEIAMNGDGDAVVAWTRFVGPNRYGIQAVHRPAGGAFGPPVDLSTGENASLPKVAFGGGTAVVMWRVGERVRAAVRPAGGSFGAAADLAPRGWGPDIAVDDAGNATAVWTRHPGVVQASVRPAGGDTIAPTTADDVPSGVQPDPHPVTLTAADNPWGSGVARIYYTKGATPPDPTTLSHVYDPASKPMLTDGERIKYRAEDRAGNLEPVKTSREVEVDIVAPGQPVIDSPPDDSYSRTGTIQLLGRAEAGSTVEIYVGGRRLGAVIAAPDGRWSWNPSGFADGPHTFRVTARDFSENVSVASAPVTVTVDTHAPDTAITAGPSGTTTSTSAGIFFISEDESATFRCRLDGPAAAGHDYVTCGSPRSYANLPAGDYTFRVHAVDAAGNPDATESTLMWTVAPAPASSPAPAPGLGTPPSGVLGDSSSSLRVVALGHNAGGTITLTLEVPGPGAVAVAARSKSRVRPPGARRRAAKRRITVSRASVEAAAGGRTTITLPPSRTARRLLRRRSLATVISVRYTPRAGAVQTLTRTVRLRRVR